MERINMHGGKHGEKEPFVVGITQLLPSPLPFEIPLTVNLCQSFKGTLDILKLYYKFLT